MLGVHGSKTRCRDDDAYKANHIHYAAGVDFNMEPDAERIVDYT